MARIQLHISDAPQRMTLHAMLEAAGHTLVDVSPDVAFTDSLERAAGISGSCKTFLLASASDVPGAVRAMRDSGLWGYVFVPLQPGEAALAVDRSMSGDLRKPEGAATMRSLEDVEMEHIHRVLASCKHNQAKAARMLGIGRNTLWRKLKRHEKSGPSAT